MKTKVKFVPIPIDPYEKLEREALNLPLRDRLLLVSLLLESLDDGEATDENKALCSAASRDCRD